MTGSLAHVIGAILALRDRIGARAGSHGAAELDAFLEIMPLAREGQTLAALLPAGPLQREARFALVVIETRILALAAAVWLRDRSFADPDVVTAFHTATLSLNELTLLERPLAAAEPAAVVS